MPISTASRKQKGRKLQQFVRDSFIQMLKQFGVEPDDVKSTSMGAGGKDVTFSPFAQSLVPLSIECKSHKSFAVYNIYEQAENNASKDEVPLVVLKANNKKPLAVMDYDYFVGLLESDVKRSLKQ